MTITLELTLEEEARLTAKARAVGIDDPAEYLREMIGAPAAPAAPQPEEGFDYLKRILPQIERMTVTDQDLAGVELNGPLLK